MLWFLLPFFLSFASPEGVGLNLKLRVDISTNIFGRLGVWWGLFGKMCHRLRKVSLLFEVCDCAMLGGALK